MVDKTVTLTEKRFSQLLLAEEKLNRLEAGRVDDWYGEPLYPENEKPEDYLKTFEEFLTKNYEQG